MAKNTVSIYMRRISLEVVLPEALVSLFMRKFGERFSVEHSDRSTNIRPVDTYFDHPKGWHVRVTVNEQEERGFYNFLRGFCKEAAISFIDPRATV